jgi:uncharacterized protein (TIGR03118 family)
MTRVRSPLCIAATCLLALSVAACDDDDENEGGGGGVTPSPDMAVAPAPDLGGVSQPSQTLIQTNLTSDRTDAANQDPNLVNAWGLAFNPAGPIWISAAGTGKAVVYNTSGASTGLVVTIPTPPGAKGPASPTGQVFNGTANFQGDLFIFDTEEGVIAGWRSGTAAGIRVDRSGTGAIYKGLALATRGGAARLFAADFHNARIDVFDASYATVSLPAGRFTDPQIPAGFAPFNVVPIGDALFVTYAKQDANAEDDVAGPGLGYVDVYDFDGLLLRRFASQGVLNAPWGVAQAPAELGALANQILIGNFGDGTIHAFNPTNGAAGPAVLGANGQPLVIDGLWALSFGAGAPGAGRGQLFFTAGPDDETHGLFGRLDLAPR